MLKASGLQHTACLSASMATSDEYSTATSTEPEKTTIRSGVDVPNIGFDAMMAAVKSVSNADVSCDTPKSVSKSAS